MRLFSEIKRRNVHRMAALYVVVAWLIMQVTGVVGDLVGIPDWVGPTVLGLLAIGFPIALVFSWFYEITPEGIELDENVDSDDTRTGLRRKRINFIVTSLLCAAVLMFAYDKWWSPGLSVESIAVLPINALSANPEIGYLADSLTADLSSELGRVAGLTIRSSQSTNLYRDSDKMLPEIARDLAVDALLEGSIQYLGDKLRINLQLIDGRTDSQLWSGSYERDFGDILTQQGEVVRGIASAVHISLNPETEAQLRRDRSTSREVISYWAVGWHNLKALEPDAFRRAIEVFEEAVRLDPEFADAYAGMAITYAQMGAWFGSEETATVLPKARMAAEEAIRLDPALAAAHSALAGIFLADWDWGAAGRAYRNALKRDQSSWFTLIEFANFLTAMGRAEEAVQVATRAVEVDPKSPISYNELAWALFLGGQSDAALEQFRYALQLDPGFLQTNLLLPQLHIFNGDYNKALPYLERLEEDFDTQARWVQAAIGFMYGKIGSVEKTESILKTLMAAADSEHIPASAFAMLHIGLGNQDAALDWLETAYEERDTIWHLNVFWAWDGLREEPRFKDLVSRMRFPG